MRVENKADFIATQATGKLGNYLRSWSNLTILRESGYRGFITIRAKDRQSKWCVPVSSTDTVETDLAKILDDGGPGAGAFYFQEIPSPDAWRVIQFELEYIEHLHRIALHYETDTKEALRGIVNRGKLAYGLGAWEILRARLWPQSYEILRELHEQYPEAVIEATEFSKRCGVFEDHLIIWEVRNF